MTAPGSRPPGSPLARRLRFPEIDPAGLLADINRRKLGPRAEIAGFYCERTDRCCAMR